MTNDDGRAQPNPTLAGRARDTLFRRTFQGLFVYNILFEDSEVDESILDLDEHSRVLAISGAGCGVAAMMARHPERIDAVDLNPHHLALTAIKAEGPRRLATYGVSTTCSDVAGTRDPRRRWRLRPRCSPVGPDRAGPTPGRWVP